MSHASLRPLQVAAQVQDLRLTYREPLRTLFTRVRRETVWKIEMGPEMEIREAPRGHKGVSTGHFCHQTRTVENPSSIFQTVALGDSVN